MASTPRPIMTSPTTPKCIIQLELLSFTRTGTRSRTPKEVKSEINFLLVAFILIKEVTVNPIVAGKNDSCSLNNRMYNLIFSTMLSA